ncbi:MAG: glycosyltransferase [Gammaproteobacteria bacterium]|nr:glycosyltransferase [Gammaproteobacteria bacterium]
MTLGLRIGYVPMTPALDAPGDRRRFVHYARARNLRFEIADPSREYDVVILSQRADLSVWSRYPKGRLVYDLIDSYLAIPRGDIKGRLRGLAKFVTRQSHYPQLDHWKAIEAMCQRADAVVCSTEEQKRDISPFCSNVHIILDAHSMVTRTVKHDYAASQPFRLVWEGMPQTLGSLDLIRSALEKLRQKHPVELHLVTDIEYYRYLGRYGRSSTLKAARRIFPDVHLHEWKEEDCADIICACDIAVIPLVLDDPFIAGKPENKLLLFWRMGMPVVASATPAYVRAMQGAGLDLTCRDKEQWLPALERLLADEAARCDAGCRGKTYADHEFGEDRLLARWDAVFASLGFTCGAHAPILP